jgi:type IV pilus assembly protein PilV
MLRNQTDSKFRTDAVFLANEVVGLAYGDLANLAQYVTAPGALCTRAKCADWVAKVGRGLPSGQATVVYTALTGRFVVTLTWTMPDGPHRYVTETAVTPFGLP